MSEEAAVVVFVLARNWKLLVKISQLSAKNSSIL